MLLLMPSLCCPVVCRDRRGHVLQPAPFQSSAKSGDVARVEPNKKWFGELVMGIPWMLLTNLPLVWSVTRSKTGKFVVRLQIILIWMSIQSKWLLVRQEVGR